MFYLTQGDVLTAKTDVIVHQVNCKGVMGAGLAKQIRNKFPQDYQAYRQYCLSDNQPLGTTLFTPVSTGYMHKTRPVIAHLFGQDGYGRDRQHTDLTAVELALQDLVSQMWKHQLKTIAIPVGMGCGLGGANWEFKYYPLLKKYLEPFFDVYFYKRG